MNKGTCTRTDCRVTFDQCPRNERNALGDLTAIGFSNDVVGCLSPCKKWNYLARRDEGQPEQNDDGRMLCCPNPVSPDDCRHGIVVQTEYVKLIHRLCPSAYSYSYDNLVRPHSCPSVASFAVNFHSAALKQFWGR